VIGYPLARGVAHMGFKWSTLAGPPPALHGEAEGFLADVTSTGGWEVRRKDSGAIVGQGGEVGILTAQLEADKVLERFEERAHSHDPRG
jgi:hypothetical protein